jgi:hypothetical protein
MIDLYMLQLKEKSQKKDTFFPVPAKKEFSLSKHKKEKQRVK